MPLDRALETLQDGLPWKLVAVTRIAGGLSATSLPAAIGALPAQGPTPDLVGEILRDRRRLRGPRDVLNRRTADHDLVALRERQRRLPLDARVLEQRHALIGRLAGERDVHRVVENRGIGGLGIDLRVRLLVEEAELELQGQDSPHRLVDARHRHRTVVDIGEQAVDELRPEIHVLAHRHIDTGHDGDPDRVGIGCGDVVAAVQCEDVLPVGDDEPAESHLVAQHVVQHVVRGMDGDVVQRCTVGHGGSDAGVNPRLEGTQERLLQVTHRDLGHGAVMPGDRLRVGREVFVGCGDDRMRRVVPLEPLDGGRA